MPQLLDLEQVAAALALLFLHTGVQPTLSELELTLDFPPLRASELRRVYVPRARTRKNRGRWFCVGSRNSAVSVRGYPKCEDGMQTARVELVARRRALRSWDLNSIDDIHAAQWVTLVAPRLRFVTLDPNARCSTEERTRLLDDFDTLGVSATLRGLPKARRESVRRQLRPAPITAEVTRLLRQLTGRADAARKGEGSHAKQTTQSFAGLIGPPRMVGWFVDEFHAHSHGLHPQDSIADPAHNAGWGEQR